MKVNKDLKQKRFSTCNSLWFKEDEIFRGDRSVLSYRKLRIWSRETCWSFNMQRPVTLPSHPFVSDSSDP